MPGTIVNGAMVGANEGAGGATGGAGGGLLGTTFRPPTSGLSSTRGSPSVTPGGTRSNGGATPLPPPPRIHSYLNSKQMHVDAIPTNELPDVRDLAIDAVLSLLWPHEPQVVFRSSCVAYVTEIIRRTLNAKVFETGLHSLQCFLPDDPIRLSVLLWRGNSG